MRAETDRKVAAIRERGEAELAQQRAEAVQELRGQIGGLSTDLAGRILGRPVAYDDQNVVSYLAELDERQTAGGQR
jgi:F-type H+-transporting ATPase subunit b